MTKQQFIALYQEKIKLSSKKEAEKFVDGFFSTLEEILVKGDNLSIIGFGKFETTIRAARTCRNPNNGELIQVPEKKVVKFRVGKSLAEKVAE